MGHFNEEALQLYHNLCAEKEGIDFSEEEVYDFTRCVRPNGTFYGTAGRCRKGTETAPAEKKVAEPRAKSSRSENITKIRNLVKEQKQKGATRRQLKSLRGKQQIEERTRKLEGEAKKRGKSVNELAAQKARESDRKADQSLLKKARERLSTAIAEGNKAGEKNYRRAVERLTEKLAKK
jgi:hypothetical protein